MPHIFDRFFQVDKIHPNGSGIGLSLAKAFVELHGGSIDVSSEVGKGSVFTVIIPIHHMEGGVLAHSTHISPEDVDVELDEVEMPSVEISKDKTVVLVIDDNPDIRSVIASVLKESYIVISASNGAKGIKMAVKYVPDLIICDVMMPIMDGLECCRRLKTEPATSHIPVLILTACSMDEQRIQGYECGADGYLSKPFNSRVLLSRCQSLIENRKRINPLQTTGRTEVRVADAAMPESNEVSVAGLDNEFYSKFVELVEQEMSDPNLTVDSIARRMGLGRTQFYRKLKALTNYSPVELLRNMRLAKARSLLTATDRSVSEIAYEVGFSTPAYFGKCYKDRYNETPTDIRERLNKKS